MVERYQLWVTQLLTLSLPHGISNICRFLPNCCLGKSGLFPNPPWDASATADTFYLYLCTTVSQAGFPAGRGNSVSGARRAAQRAGTSPSLCLSLLNLSAGRRRQKQQIPTVPTCYSHTFRKSPRNCQWTFLSNGSIRSFTSAAPLFMPKAAVWMKG